MGAPRVLDAVRSRAWYNGKAEGSLVLLFHPNGTGSGGAVGITASTRIIWQEGPARTDRTGFAGASVAVAAAVRTRPDQVVALAVLAIDEIGENRGIEARIVELETQIIAALVGAPGPSRPDLDLMRSTA
ncbi:hypothetical protein AD953_15470 [Acetobacter malorum]|uniref:Uncharacterized protein n=1 Tax=Acetobacter malorum TaxID=178901 RepID=A0A149V0E7_9PROT|nr:hypothetical protein AD953_15470 [Acetobacter malorum]